VTTTGPQGPPGPAGSGGAHAITHTPGNTDPIPDVAWTNVANTFTPNQTFNGNLNSFGPGGTAGITATYLSLDGSGAANTGPILALRQNSIDVGGMARDAAFSAGASNALTVFGLTADGLNLQSNGPIRFRKSGPVELGRIHQSGGFSWGSTVDPGVGNLSVAGVLSLPSPNAGRVLSAIDATTGANYAQFSNSGNTLYIGVDSSVGGTFNTGAVYGAVIQSPWAPGIGIGAVHAGGSLRLQAGGYAVRGIMHSSGGFSWGSTTDPGAGSFLIAPGAASPGNNFNHQSPGVISLGSAGTAPTIQMYFSNANGPIGSIAVAGTTTTFNTTSDARLRQDRGRLTDTIVLEQTIVHAFDWIAGGLPGRGVFAQEAVEVAPFAVSVGTDELNEQGLLAKPWGVDYSKYVPDLIAGWQAHEAKIAKLEAMIEKLLT